MTRCWRDGWGGCLFRLRAAAGYDIGLRLGGGLTLTLA